MNNHKTTRTRIAPSPTGANLHIGNLYTALINYTVAKKNNGQFIVRIEDTDRARLVEGAEAKILSTLESFGIHYDESPNMEGPFGPYRQSDRLDIYQKYARELVEKKKAYYCFCSKERLDTLRRSQQEEKKTPRYDKHCLHADIDADKKIKDGEPYVLRLNVEQNTTVTFEDLIRGEIEFSTNEIDDQVLIKSDGYPTYHMAVVIDDHLMEISHIIRAEEWISSTPKHVLLYAAFGWELPIFAHVPILRNPDRSKLSKRKNPVWANEYLELGYLQEAVLNYLALMGWSHPEEKEIFSLDEYIQVFELSDIKPAGPIFDRDKLTWMNGEYIRLLSDAELKRKLFVFDTSLQSLDGEILDAFLPLAKTRIKTLSEFKSLVSPFIQRTPCDLEESDAKNREILINVLTEISEWNGETVLAGLKQFIQIVPGKNFKYLYTIVIGADSGLPLVDVFVMLGKEKTLELLS